MYDNNTEIEENNKLIPNIYRSSVWTNQIHNNCFACMMFKVTNFIGLQTQ